MIARLLGNFARYRRRRHGLWVWTPRLPWPLRWAYFPGHYVLAPTALGNGCYIEATGPKESP